MLPFRNQTWHSKNLDLVFTLTTLSCWDLNLAKRANKLETDGKSKWSWVFSGANGSIQSIRAECFKSRLNRSRFEDERNFRMWWLLKSFFFVCVHSALPRLIWIRWRGSNWVNVESDYNVREVWGKVHLFYFL